MSRTWILLIASLCVGGCSHLHVDSVPHWQSMTSPRLCLVSETNPDYRDQVAAGLRRGGWEFVGACDDNVPSGAVRADYQLQWVTDLDAEARVTQRPASFHLQLRSAGDQTLLAVADYFFPNPPEAITVGINAACAALARQAAEPGVKEVPSQPAAVIPQAAKSVTPAVEPVESTEKRSISKEDSDGGSTPSEAAPVEVKPMQTSPWIPRFKSWGLDGWDDSAQDDKINE